MHPTDNVPDWKPLLDEHGAYHPSNEKRQGKGRHRVRSSRVSADLQGTAAGGKEIHEAVKANETGMAYPSNCLSLGKNREALGHSAAFPVNLPAFFIAAYSDVGDVVFDPFMGSGTTMIAAHRAARVCVGLELSPAYCDVAVERWEKFTGKKATRVARPKKKKAKKAKKAKA